MAYLTFLYFLCVFIYIIRKRGVDISACIIGAYMVSAFLSIYLLKNSIDYSDKNPSFLPSIIYCSMITLVTIPFYRFDSTRVRDFPKVNIRVFNFLSWVLIFGFIFSVFLFKDDILLRLAFGQDIGTLRGQAGRDLGTAQASLSGPFRALSSLFMTILSLSPVSFILFFYSVTFLRKKLFFNILLFLSSFGCLISSIIGIDRSVFFYWTIDFIFIYVLFRPYLSKKIKKYTAIIGMCMLSLVATYLIIMTLSRFEDRAAESFFDYFGQSYLNFCWFWDNYETPLLNWGILCPITTHFFDIDWGAPVGAVSFGLFVETKVGYFVNLFYTFMGSVMLYLGQWAVIPFCFVFYKISNSLLNKHSCFGVQTFIRIFILAVVPYCGVILYLYVDYIRFMAALIMLLFCYLLDQRMKK